MVSPWNVLSTLDTRKTNLRGGSLIVRVDALAIEVDHCVLVRGGTSARSRSGIEALVLRFDAEDISDVIEHYDQKHLSIIPCPFSGDCQCRHTLLACIRPFASRRKTWNRGRYAACQPWRRQTGIGKLLSLLFLATLAHVFHITSTVRVPDFECSAHPLVPASRLECDIVDETLTARCRLARALQALHPLHQKSETGRCSKLGDEGVSSRPVSVTPDSTCFPC